MEASSNVIISTPTGDVDASKATLPGSGRKFRGAWRAEGNAIEVDMDAARDIAREEIRRARTALMQQLDVEYMRAQERAATPLELGDIVANKQALRDAPADPRLDEAEDDTSLAEAVDAIIAEMGG